MPTIAANTLHSPGDSHFPRIDDTKSTLSCQRRAERVPSASCPAQAMACNVCRRPHTGRLLREVDAVLPDLSDFSNLYYSFVLFS